MNIADDLVKAFNDGYRQGRADATHGKWIEAKVNGMSLYPYGQKMCSVCETIMPSTWKTMPPYCFGCGAKMGKEDT